uniref:Uncharacterized protein n=1 Tax=Ignisphaera aggregans TaxID=334771 RepID=A0A7J2TB67_9CREN
MNLRDILNSIELFIKKGVEYVIAIYPYVYSYPYWRDQSVVLTLSPLVGGEQARKICTDIYKLLKYLDLDLELRKKVQRLLLNDKYITSVIIEEAKKRLSTANAYEKRLLKIVYTLIRAPETSLMLKIRITEDEHGFTTISEQALNSLIKDKVDLGALLVKYFLAFKVMIWEGSELKLYPFVFSRLAESLSLMTDIKEANKAGNILGISMLYHIVFDIKNKDFLVHFFGEPLKHYAKKH